MRCRFIEKLNFDNLYKFAPTKHCFTSFHQKSNPMAFNVFFVCIIQTKAEGEEEKQKGKHKSALSIKWNGNSKVFRYCCQILLRLTFVWMDTHRNIRGMHVMKIKNAESSKFEGHFTTFENVESEYIKFNFPTAISVNRYCFDFFSRIEF